MSPNESANALDSEFADTLIARLNAAIADPAVRADVGRLIATRIPCSDATLNHPTIQAGTNDAGVAEVGVLGVLNGIVGTIPSGKWQGWGYVAAYVDDDGTLVRFERTDRPEADAFDAAEAPR